MADFWIIEYKERIYEDNTPEEEPDKFEEWQLASIDIDSIVTIELSKNNHGMHWLEVDNGYTYHAKILKKVTEDGVIAEMDMIHKTRHGHINN